MYNGSRYLGIIPARGGSKGLERKNLLPLLGKPLIGWTIESAKCSRYLDRVVVSTEDHEIAEKSKSLGADVPFIRPSEMAQDDSSVVDVVLHALEMLGHYEYVVLLQPTSPLRMTEDIDTAIELISTSKSNSLVSVTEPQKSPFWMYTLDYNNKLSSLVESNGITRRQDLPPTFALNGAVYIVETCWFQENRKFISDDSIGYKMVQNRSVDIDTLEDFLFCQVLLEVRKQETCTRQNNKPILDLSISQPKI